MHNANSNGERAMTSKEVKAIFANYKIKVRVRDLGQTFRICKLSGEAFDMGFAGAILCQYGFTDVYGYPGASFVNGPTECVAYKPGRRVRLKA